MGIVMQVIYDTKAGKVAQAAAAFGGVLEHLVSQGVEVAVLGCTEFPLVMARLEAPAGLTLIDSTDVLAEVVVRTCKGDWPLMPSRDTAERTDMPHASHACVLNAGN